MHVYPGARKPFCRGEVHAADIHGMFDLMVICIYTVGSLERSRKEGGCVCGMYGMLRVGF